MIKVLIAEDELPLLRGIANMIERIDNEFCVVKRAKNGLEALEYIKKEAVDIVFTDINMPMLNGLELLEQVAEHYPEIATVVISGFDEFSYVQKAICYRAKNYLLKPVNAEELTKLLRGLKKEIKHLSFKEQEEFLTKSLFGNEIVEETKFFGKIYPICLCAGACSISNGTDTSSVNEFWGKIPIRSILYDVCERKESIFCYLGRNSNELIILLEESDKKSIEEIAGELLKKIAGELPLTIIYDTKELSMSDIRKTVFTLLDRIHIEGRYGENSIICKQEQFLAFELSLSEENAIVYAVKKENAEELKKALATVIKRMKETGIGQKNLESVVLSMAKIMCLEKDDSHTLDKFTLEIMDLIEESFSLDQFFEDAVLLWEKFFSGENGENGKELMQEVDYYIRTHIEQPITTKMLARKFGLVSPYLSRLFKEFKGESPTQYIQNIRIQCAKELLYSYPDMLAKEVAELIGYSNPLYFSKIFKKKVGIYPSEYRIKKPQ